MWYLMFNICQILEMAADTIERNTAELLTLLESSSLWFSYFFEDCRYIIEFDFFI